MELSFEPFKEPRGFLKILQWLFAICAFATTVSFSTTLSFDLACTEISPNVSIPGKTISQVIEYPFAIDTQIQYIQVCNETFEDIQFPGHARSDSEFFVTTGVLSFLYATGLIAVYLLAEKLYTENPRIPMIDFFVTLVFALFWLAGSSAWANGLTNLKTGADLESWVPSYETIEGVYICHKDYATCSNFVTGTFGGIVISILFGFINVILWTANIWFLYKETSWFDGLKTPNTNAGTSTGA